MNNKFYFMLFIIVFSIHGLPIKAQGAFLNEFPEQCTYATDREPLPGHIIRLGFIGHTPYGWSFFFPDRQTSDNLERVSIAVNVGIIGQDPSQDFGPIIRARTPSGAFVVAQIFVADQNAEPVVTCVSQVRPLSGYIPSYFGRNFAWLDRYTFSRWLNFRVYKKKWFWRKWWGRSFDDIRRRFKGFKHHFKYHDRRRKFERFRDRDFSRRFEKFRSFDRDRKFRGFDRSRKFRDGRKSFPHFKKFGQHQKSRSFISKKFKPSFKQRSFRKRDFSKRKRRS